MKRMYVSSLVVLAVVSLLRSQSHDPAFGWRSLGLENHVVHCVLADDTTKIIAGTDKGIMVRWRATWYQATSGLPVHALARVSDGRIAAAIGDGKSKSDGIYLGRNIINGPPFYGFEVLCWMNNPGALAVSGSGDTLYACSGKELNRYVLPKKIDPALLKPEAIKLPPYAFGVEQPSCQALELFSGRLVAGGYDKSPNPGKGHLLYNVKDSMHVEREMNVSAMTPYSIGFVGPSLAVGTMDSGIYVGRILGPTMPPVKPWSRFDSPKNEPVNAMVAIPTAIEGEALAVAVKSGVFTSRLTGTFTWTEIGSIPNAPRCLALYGNGWAGFSELSYIAGTDKGVFHYTRLSTGIQAAGNGGGASPAQLDAIAGNGGPRLVFSSPSAGGAEVAVRSIAGRLLCKCAVPVCAGENSIGFPSGVMGRGLYLVSVRGAGFAPLCRTVAMGN